MNPNVDSRLQVILMCPCKFTNCSKCTTLVGNMLIIGGNACVGASQVALVVKNPPANAGNTRDADSIPGSGRCPGKGHGNSLQYSYLGNATENGSWEVTVYRVTESYT